MFASPNGLNLGYIGRHQLVLDPIGFGILAVWAIYAMPPLGVAIAFIVAAFLSILVHELGHAFTIEKLTGESTLVSIGFGGVTMSLGPRTAGRQLLISLAGPGAGFVFGGIGWGAAHLLTEFRSAWPGDFYTEGSIWLITLQAIVLTSFWWGVLNLAPALPLDGGQALRAGLIHFGMTEMKGRRISRRVSMATALAGGAWAITRERPEIFILLFCLWILSINIQEGREEGY